MHTYPTRGGGTIVPGHEHDAAPTRSRRCAIGKYTASARWYDLISFEKPVYRAGRVAAVDLLGLRAGERVLDLGCGTGLNFPLLEQRIGPAGLLVGLDRSPQMLRQARRRAEQQGWSNVRLREADATALAGEGLRELASTARGFDAVIATYALSLMPGWRGVLDSVAAALAPGGRVAVVDMQLPTGRASVFGPLARLACRLGGADIEAHPWSYFESAEWTTVRRSVRGDHIQVAVATRGAVSTPER